MTDSSAQYEEPRTFVDRGCAPAVSMFKAAVAAETIGKTETRSPSTDEAVDTPLHMADTSAQYETPVEVCSRGTAPRVSMFNPSAAAALAVDSPHAVAAAVG